MNCSICHRPHGTKKLPFLCAVDARNRLYESRVEIAQALIQNEEVERQVKDAVSSQETATHAQVGMENSRAEEEAAKERTSQIIAQADRLKADIDAARQEVEKKKDAIARKQSDLASVSSGSSPRRNRQLEEIERSAQRIKYKWNRSAETMAATRAFLCEEAARLYGLRQVKKGSAKRYEIGGVEIVELHAMNNVSPELISTSLAHIAHILVLASHYLAIRLPAEVTLPHRDYPQPTIFSLASSYRHGDIPFPGSAPVSQTPPSTGDGKTGRIPRPRPLFLDKPLPTLAKDDPAAYSLFLEGVGLLAYNIAWACCSQGVSFGDKDSYDDMSNMGQNLWRLLIGDQVHRRSVEPTFPLSLMPSKSSPVDDEHAEITKPKTLIGRWSHGTAHAFLGGVEGAELVRNFKVLSPVKLVDRLKKRLSSEPPMLEWETIEGHEAEDGYEDELGVLASEHEGGKFAGRVGLGIGNDMTARAVETSAAVSDSGNPARATGINGWTRVKNR
ncbi:UV radiation resistance protein and autophagy-related subunit 14-domain-containing protein [Lasiosphaeria hispida]|uniref:Autophagy-related protein 14 n=1 Tax=Lasiosphaeria hispida TaxID=260671 RepID=A0AAJ0MJF3_9PEZI|nr:UV radiation resistance protein and autophagy-related subunit 14-domain-containing protein [Lasiosphaeria hispida]